MTTHSAKASKALAELLKQMSQAGIESLQKNLAELQKRLDAGEKGESPPSAEEMRAMANRLDALRRAMEQADALGMQEMRDLLASLGNEDLLEQIAQRMREIASKLDSAGYEGLESGEMGESFDLSELTREELEELLKQLDELAAMEDLARMLQQGGGESAGGRRLRLGGSGGT